MTSAKAQYADSKRNLDRTSDLYKKGLESELNYSAALTTNESNAAALKSAQASLDRAKIKSRVCDDLHAHRWRCRKQSRQRRPDCGGEFFVTDAVYHRERSQTHAEYQTTVDESDVGRISIGQEATFTVDAYSEDKFTGRVSQIRLAPQSIQNVVNYIVIINVENDQLKLMPGMTANVKILVASATNALRVSNMALRFQPPADLIDTTGAGGMRGSFAGRGEMGRDSSRSGGNTGVARDSAARGGFGASGGSGGQGMEGGGFQPSAEMMRRFQAVRDSIQAAHGGKLSQEELRAEVRKLFVNRMSPSNPPAQAAKPKQKLSGGAATFGIVSNFPEYQKSAYIPSHQSGRGRVWILKPNGLLEQVFVRTGLNDGRYTEITSMRLKPGDQIVLGATSNGDSGTSPASSPLTGQTQGQRPPGGGGFR